MANRPAPRHARKRTLPPVLPFLASLSVLAALVISALPHGGHDQSHSGRMMTSDALLQPAATARPAAPAVTAVVVNPAPGNPDPVVHVPVVPPASPSPSSSATATAADSAVSTGNPSVPAPTVTPSVTQPAPPNSSSGSGIGARMLAEAETRTGDWYAWGGTGPSTFDCSGLVYWAAGQLGIANWPRDTYELLHAGVSEGLLVPTSSPRPGDLAFFGTGHVEFVYSTSADEVFGAQQTGTQVGVQRWYPGSWQPTAYYRIT